MSDLYKNMDWEEIETKELKETLKSYSPKTICAALVLLSDEMPLSKEAILTAASRIIAESENPDRVTGNFAALLREHLREIQNKKTNEN